MENLLLNPREVEFLVEDNGKGIWRRFMFPDGRMFAEFTTHATLFGLPLIHITWGRNPETMRYITAKGIIAIGRFAKGFVAVGQVSAGVIAIGQASIGLFFGLGQATIGIAAIGQLAVGGIFGLGQFTCGFVAIGQIAVGEYVMAQIGVGSHVWDSWRGDILAKQFFRQLLFK
jgi:hypothetical protein